MSISICQRDDGKSMIKKTHHIVWVEEAWHRFTAFDRRCSLPGISVGGFHVKTWPHLPGLRRGSLSEEESILISMETSVVCLRERNIYDPRIHQAGHHVGLSDRPAHHRDRLLPGSGRCGRCRLPMRMPRLSLIQPAVSAQQGREKIRLSPLNRL